MNAQSIASKINELVAVAQDLAPDIILLTESWCNSTTPDAALSIDGYDLETELRRDRADTSAGIGGGLLVYTKKDLKVMACDSYSNIDFNQFCAFKVATEGEPLSIVLTYRPPSAGPTNTARLCEILRTFKQNTILVGDINLPNIDWDEERSDAKGRELLETVIEEGLQQLVGFPTHTKGNILDLVITNCPDRVLHVQDEGRLGKSDHCMISVTVECRPKTEKETGPTYNWKRADIPAIQRELDGVDWRKELENRTTEEGWILLRNKVQAAVEKFVPQSKNRTKLEEPMDDKRAVEANKKEEESVEEGEKIKDS